MPRGLRMKSPRKAGAWTAGELLEGEIGVNTSAKRLEFSTNGSDVIALPPERIPFSFNADSAGYYRYNAACTLTLESAAVGTGTLAYATSPDGTTWTTVTLPNSPSAAGVLRVTLSGCTTYNAATLVRT